MTTSGRSERNASHACAPSLTVTLGAWDTNPQTTVGVVTLGSVPASGTVVLVDPVANAVIGAPGSTLTVDGRPVYGSVSSFERAGEAHGSTYVVRAERIDGDLWQVEALPL